MQSSLERTVHVIVVTYNSSADIERCLTSVESDPSISLISVIDNGSEDRTVEIVRTEHPSVRLLDTGGNSGFAAAVNLAAADVSTDWLLLLNPDAYVHPGSLKELLTFAAAHRERGLFGGRALKSNGESDPATCWGAPSLWSSFLFSLGVSTLAKKSNFLNPEALGGWDRNSIRIVPVVSGCLLLISQEAWSRLGGFDTSFFLYGEDADFSRRAIDAGFAPTIVPTALISHALGGSSSATSRTSMILAGKATYYRKHLPPFGALLSVIFLQAGVALRYLGENLGIVHSEGWAEAWRRRSIWRRGYPTSLELFGSERSHV